MGGPIALVGGDEFRAGCVDMDRALLEATGVARPRVLILPTAAASQDPSKAAANGVAYFSSLGAMASALMALGPAEASDEPFLSPVDDADVVYFTGGDPGHLLDTLRESKLLDRVLAAHRRGAVLAGSSAGAMVMGSWMRLHGWTAALGIVEGLAVLPHHEGSDPSSVAPELQRTAPPEALVLGIDSGTGCLVGARRWQVLGAGGVTSYFQGQFRRYRSGDAVPVPSSVRAS